MVRFVKRGPTSTKSRQASQSPPATFEGDNQDYSKDKCRYSECEGVTSAREPMCLRSICSGIYRIEPSNARSEISDSNILGTIIGLLGLAGDVASNFGTGPHQEASTY